VRVFTGMGVGEGKHVIYSSNPSHSMTELAMLLQN